MVEHCFNVFGTPVAVRTCDGGWCAFYLGTDGTSRPTDFIVPADIPADDLPTSSMSTLQCAVLMSCLVLIAGVG